MSRTMEELQAQVEQLLQENHELHFQMCDIITTHHEAGQRATERHQEVIGKMHAIDKDLVDARLAAKIAERRSEYLERQNMALMRQQGDACFRVTLNNLEQEVKSYRFQAKRKAEKTQQTMALMSSEILRLEAELKRKDDRIAVLERARDTMMTNEVRRLKEMPGRFEALYVNTDEEPITVSEPTEEQFVEDQVEEQAQQAPPGDFDATSDDIEFIGDKADKAAMRFLEKNKKYGPGFGFAKRRSVQRSKKH